MKTPTTASVCSRKSRPTY